MPPLGTSEAGGRPVATVPLRTAVVVVTEVAAVVTTVGARGLDAVGQLAPSFGVVRLLACVMEVTVGEAAVRCAAEISTRLNVMLSKK